MTRRRKDTNIRKKAVKPKQNTKEMNLSKHLPFHNSSPPSDHKGKIKEPLGQIQNVSTSRSESLANAIQTKKKYNPPCILIEELNDAAKMHLAPSISNESKESDVQIRISKWLEKLTKNAKDEPGNECSQIFENLMKLKHADGKSSINPYDYLESQLKRIEMKSCFDASKSRVNLETSSKSSGENESKSSKRFMEEESDESAQPRIKKPKQDIQTRYVSQHNRESKHDMFITRAGIGRNLDKAALSKKHHRKQRNWYPKWTRRHQHFAKYTY